MPGRTPRPGSGIRVPGPTRVLRWVRRASVGNMRHVGAPADHSDERRWDARYSAGFTPSFAPHPLAVTALPMLPAGPVADLACGPSGSALLAAAAGRKVTAVDISKIALDMLGREAHRRGLAEMIALVHADLAAWRPPRGRYALVLCTGYWDRVLFAAAVGAVAPGGLLGWEAFTDGARRARPGLCPDWCLGPGEPASLLPASFALLDESDLPDPDRGDRRRLLARQKP